MTSIIEPLTQLHEELGDYLTRVDEIRNLSDEDLISDDYDLIREHALLTGALQELFATLESNPLFGWWLRIRNHTTQEETA